MTHVLYGKRRLAEKIAKAHRGGHTHRAPSNPPLPLAYAQKMSELH